MRVLFLAFCLVALPAFAQGWQTGDTDQDGVPDVVDNCKTEANPMQADVGGVGPTTGPDGIGDACQCGDANNDGRVTGLDGTLISRASLGLSPYELTGVNGLPAPQKCDVNGGTTGDAAYHCSGLDATIITRASLGLSPGVQQTCEPAEAPSKACIRNESTTSTLGLERAPTSGVVKFFKSTTPGGQTWEAMAPPGWCWQFGHFSRPDEIRARVWYGFDVQTQQNLFYDCTAYPSLCPFIDPTGLPPAPPGEVCGTTTPIAPYGTGDCLGVIEVNHMDVP